MLIHAHAVYVLSRGRYPWLKVQKLSCISWDFSYRYRYTISESHRDIPFPFERQRCKGRTFVHRKTLLLFSANCYRIFAESGENCWHIQETECNQSQNTSLSISVSSWLFCAISRGGHSSKPLQFSVVFYGVKLKLRLWCWAPLYTY